MLVPHQLEEMHVSVGNASERSSGVEVLDGLIDGVRVGDNLVIMVDSGVPHDWLVDRYIETSDPERLIVVDGSGRHGGAAADHRLLDWSTDAAPTPEHARAALADADEQVGFDARFLFDSLSSLGQRWGDPAALDLFMWACPRLFRRQSVALWLVDLEQHDESFLRRLTTVTQVVVAVRLSDDELVLDVSKADGRDSAVAGRTVVARLVDGDLVDARPVDTERVRLGERLRDLRKHRGIGQAELARRVGISPSALSQAERGVRAVSAETLLRIWEAMGLPVGVDDARDRGYRLYRRGSLRVETLANGVTGHQRSSDPTLWHLFFDGRAAGNSPLFPVKAVEVVIVVRGILQLQMRGAVEFLHEGDTLVADTATITAWANPSDSETEVLWLY